MKLSLTIVLTSLLSLAVGAQVRWLNDYEGTVGVSKIGLTLASPETGGFERGSDVECSYFYISQLKDIKLKCSIDIEGNFVFNELNEQGNTRAVFRGKFVKNERDMAEGTWTRAGQTKSLPFRMSFAKGVSSESGNRYSQIEADDPKWFEDQVSKFKTAVIKGDRRYVADQVRFPVTLKVDGKRVNIRTKAAFLKNYDNVFTGEFVASIAKTVPHNMFAKATGAMLGGGLVWFWGDGKIIAINN